jgi:hypothetical protein
MAALKVDLKNIYALLKVHGDLSVVDHSLCRSDRLLQLRQLAAVPDPDRERHQRKSRLLLRQEGGRLPRLRSGAGAPAVAEPAGLLTYGATLVEEHVAGVPGDVFTRRWLRRAISSRSVSPRSW